MNTEPRLHIHAYHREKRIMEKEWSNKIVTYLKAYDPSRIGIFGSYVRGEQTEKSDLDILVSLRRRIGLLQFVRMERELSELLGVKVDLVTEGSLKNEKLKTYIEKDLLIIYQ